MIAGCKENAAASAKLSGCRTYRTAASLIAARTGRPNGQLDPQERIWAETGRLPLPRDKKPGQKAGSRRTARPSHCSPFRARPGEAYILRIGRQQPDSCSASTTSARQRRRARQYAWWGSAWPTHPAGRRRQGVVAGAAEAACGAERQAVQGQRSHLRRCGMAVQWCRTDSPAGSTGRPSSRCCRAAGAMASLPQPLLAAPLLAGAAAPHLSPGRRPVARAGAACAGRWCRLLVPPCAPRNLGPHPERQQKRARRGARPAQGSQLGEAGLFG